MKKSHLPLLEKCSIPLKNNPYNPFEKFTTLSPPLMISQFLKNFNPLRIKYTLPQSPNAHAHEKKCIHPENTPPPWKSFNSIE